MPRQAKVETTFQKANPKQVHPNAGKHHNKMMKPDSLSPIAQYVHDFQDPETSQPSTRELYLQYQELECKHTSYSVIAKSGNYTGLISVSTCNGCGQVKVLGK